MMPLKTILVNIVHKNVLAIFVYRMGVITGSLIDNAYHVPVVSPSGHDQGKGWIHYLCLLA